MPRPIKGERPEHLKGKGFEGHPENINKNGRPRILPDLNELLIDCLTKEELTAILKALRTNAKKGGVRETELLLDRAFGKVKQQEEHSGNVTIKVVFEDPKNGESGE